MTSSGWDASHETFVLPLGGSLLASSDGAVSLSFDPDLELSAKALVARYTADWAAAKLQTKGAALAQRVSNCAASAQSVLAEGAQTEDVLRSALGTQSCSKLVDDVLREGSAADVATDAPRARQQIMAIAKPVLEDELVTGLTKIITRARP